nr:ABC transporter permease [Afipia sp.]
SDLWLFGYFDLPLHGSRWLLLSAGLLFILACQMFGALLALLLRSTPSAISIATLLTSPAFGYMGIGFPRLAMNSFAYGFGALLPGTWYLMARIDQTVRGTPSDLSLKPILILLAFVVSLVILAAWRLDSMRSRTDTAPSGPSPALEGATS